MKLISLICLFVILCFSSQAQYHWQALPGAPVSYRFDDFHFINPDTGWAINPNYGFNTTPQYGRIFRTYDGGNTWLKLKDSSNTYYRSVGFADGLNGWVGNLADTQFDGHYRYTTDTVPMYETHDGGVSWAPVNLPHPHPLGICGISVITDSIVFAYGRYFGPAGYVKTVDRGASWNFVNLDTLAFGLIDGHFFNKDTGFITGMGTDHKAVILATNNGGASWHLCYHSSRGDSDRVWKIYFPSRSIGYASIEYGGTIYPHNSYLLKTIDGGLSWTEKPFLANYDEEGIGFVNDSVGWIGGDYVRGTYITLDGGNTWNDDPTFGLYTPPYMSFTSDFQINRFRSFGDTLLYASGNTIYKLRPGSTGIKDLLNNGVNLSNYPNPFCNKTTITYTIPDGADNTILDVYSYAGKKVLSKSLGMQTRGQHQFLFEETLPSGIYYYQVKCDKYILSNKMVIIK